MLITGGKKGEIVLFDIRQRKLFDTIKAHSMNVKSLALDVDEQFVVSGSNEGSVKAWCLPQFQQIGQLDDAHSKQTFLSFKTSGVFTDAVSTFGVMEVQIADKYLYTCGSDGRVLRTEFSRTMSTDAHNEDAHFDGEMESE
jgi:WD40 repeat protein